MKVSKRQLKRIIKEEKLKLLNEQDDGSNHTIFSADAIVDLLESEIDNYIDYYGDPEGLRAGGDYRLTDDEGERFGTAIQGAVQVIMGKYVQS
jgi:hypothetical protein